MVVSIVRTEAIEYFYAESATIREHGFSSRRDILNYVLRRAERLDSSSCK